MCHPAHSSSLEFLISLRYPPALVDEEVCGAKELRSERILLGLRTSLGLAEETLQGHEVCLSELVQKGWGRRQDGRFLLTPRGRLRADEVATMLL